MTERELRGMDAVSRFQHLKDHMDRLLLSLDSPKELPLAIVTGVFRVSLSASEKWMLDSRQIESYEDLYDIAEVIKADSHRKHTSQRGH